jgi:hypothetical protein
MKNFPNWFCFLLISLVAVVVWGRTISYGFVWDDKLYIVDNPSVYSLKNIPAMFFTRWAQSAQPEDSKVFRPLRTVQYSILQALGGRPKPQPWIFHLANIFWHTLAACAFFVVSRRIFEKTSGHEFFKVRLMALLLAIGFVVNPVTSEVVCWAKAMDDIMAAVFVLLATAALLDWNVTNKGYWAALGCFTLAIYSKESAVPYIFVASFIFLKIQRLPLKSNLLRTGGFAAITLIYLVHRHLVLGVSTQREPISGTYGQTLIDMIPVAAQYYRLLWGIPPFCFDYVFEGSIRSFSYELLTGVLVLGGAIGALVYSWRRNFIVATAGLIWMGAFLLPVSNLLPMNAYLAERFLYLPLFGFLLVVGTMLANIRLAYAISLAVAMLATWTSLSWNRSGIWQDELTLYVRTSQECPPNSRVEGNAIVAILELPHMRAILPNYTENHKLVMVETLSPDKALPVIQTLLEAHRLFPGNGMICSLLGVTYAKVGRLEDACIYLKIATRQTPDDPWYWLELAAVLRAMGHREEARSACEKSLHLDPKNPQSLQMEIDLCRETHDLKAALDYAGQLLSMDPPCARYQSLVSEINMEIDNAKTTNP